MLDIRLLLLATLLGVAISFLLLAGSSQRRGLRVRGVLISAFLGGSLLLGRSFLLSGEVLSASKNILPAVVSTLLGLGIGGLIVFIAERLIQSFPQRSASVVSPADSLRCILALCFLWVPVSLKSATTEHAHEPRSGVGLQDPSFVVAGMYKLPFIGPLDFAFVDERRGYLTGGPGTVAAFEIPSDAEGELTIVEVVDDLQSPRGIAVKGDTLYVAELGPLPCKSPFPMCKESDDPNEPRLEFEKRLLRDSRGRILAYDIEADRSLSNMRVLVDWLPVANSMHALNQMHLGPDGMLYLSVGHVDQLKRSDAFMESLAHPGKEYLGTMLQIDPESGALKIFARGLRNVYGFTFTPRGEMYGVDNDGTTRRGWRAEELVRISEGEHYGFPYEGTFGDHKIRTAPPFWILDGVSTSVFWSDSFGPVPGFFVGYCGKIEHLRTKTAADGEIMKKGKGEAPGVESIASFAGCATAMDIRPGGNMVVGVMFDNVLAVIAPREQKATTAVEKGAIVFKTAGCPACHSLQAGQQLVGPSLYGLSQRGVPQGREQRYEEYLRESILAPEAYVVEGFAALMPKQEFKPKDLDNLVRYLQTL